MLDSGSESDYYITSKVVDEIETFRLWLYKNVH